MWQVLIRFGYSKDLLEILYRLVESEGEENIENGRERNGVDRARRAIEKYFCDPNYRLLHDQLSEGLAELLRSDVKFLNSGEKRKISLASKWCPSIDSSYDKSTLICENTARKVFPRDSDSQYDGLEEAHYAYRVRNRLHKEVLIPLRKEIHMSEEKCNRVAFNTMKAYKTYKNLYGECDEEMLYQHYFEVVHKCGKATIGEGLKLPHQIITSCLKEESESPEVAELQWGRLVEEFSKKGKFKNSLAVCDLSGNMRGSLMEDVCIAMGLLVSELSGPPWKGKVFSFSDYPKLPKHQRRRPFVQD
ncbi:hypothetical protein L1049_015401 [Liquidambar formosana]|uniref:Uncharacterized protein n=1 Tax=Liquidambar formosana TaxID=63359 RepID=A0AAP0RZJ2_LIQFO